MQGSDLVSPQRVQGSDGSYAVTGCVVRGVILEVENGGTVTITPGMAVSPIAAGATISRLGRWDAGQFGELRENRIKVQRLLASSGACALGVALETIPGGAVGEVACSGSIVMTNKVAAGDGTFGYAIATSTNGSVGISAIPVAKETLGLVVITGGIASEQSGSSAQVAVLIAPQ